MFLKWFMLKFMYKILYTNSSIQSFIGIRKRLAFEPYLSIRNHVELHADVNIGAFSLINKHTIVTPLVKCIGRFCSIGPNVYIGASNHDLRQTTSRGLTYMAGALQINLGSDLIAEVKDMHEGINKDTVLEHDVWIGGHSVILNGVRVGTGAVIAANSVVTKDVEPYCVVGGVPAKVLKYRFDKDTIDKLIRIDFYNKPLDEIIDFVKKNPRALVDVNEFLELLTQSEFRSGVRHLITP